MNKSLGLVCALICGVSGTANAAPCYATGYLGYTAALVNPASASGDIDATGCDIGVYYNAGIGKVENAKVHGALRFGVFANGDASNVAVDVLRSQIHTIGDSPLNGNQRGVAVYYRAFFSTGTATGRVADNTLSNYQKGGIVVNGQGTDVQIAGNIVTGQGPVPYIAQYGIQIGYGANASVMGNTVTGHSYTGSSTVAGGIVVVGGSGYGTCPDGNACPYTTGTRIVMNTVRDNDVGVFLTNLAADGGAPATATNVKAANNVISCATLNGGYLYQAGVSDVGNNDKIIANTITGSGYTGSWGSAFVVPVDADVSFTNRPKVQANK